MVLHIPIAAENFYDFLDKMDDAEAPTYFALYADLRFYDRSCTDDNDKEKR